MTIAKPRTNVLGERTESAENTTRVQKKRPGPKPKPIKDRTFNPDKSIKPILRPERSWSQSQKIRILVFLYHHRIPVSIPGNDIESFRPPTQAEAADLFGVPQTTISNWVRKQGSIEQLGGGTNLTVRTSRTVSICKWPDLEIRLYQLFLDRREKGQAIRRGWFRRNANTIFQELYPGASTSIFRFSNGWFEAFLGRYRVSLRAITKKAQTIPEEYRQLVVNWLQFNRRNSQPLIQLPLVTSYRVPVGGGFYRVQCRYSLSNIFNVDETPLPFEYLNGHTYNSIGAKTIWVKETKSGWDKRQASLVLCVFADGINRVPPLIIFHGKGTKYIKEKDMYHPGVIVEFNDKAYMNDQLFLRYLQDHILPVLGGRPSLFALDHCASHKTPAVLDLLRTNNIIPSMIPAGCTSLVQPLDISINKPIKERIRELTDEAILDCENNDGFERWTVGNRRILTTSCVGDAWYQFCIEKQEIIIQSFRKVGLSLPIDGSADSELDIKGFDTISIGDWNYKKTSVQSDVHHFADVSSVYDDSDVVEFVAHSE